MKDINLSLTAQQRQTQQITQQQMQSLKILTMNTADLHDMISRELENNPVLETDEGFVSSSCGIPEPYESNRGHEHNRTLQEELLLQLMTTKHTIPQGLGEHLIASLDSAGYLRYSTEDLAKATGFDKATIAASVEELQRFEPTGVFAHDLGECLQLQLRSLSSRNLLAEQLCDGYLEQVAQGRYAQLCKTLGVMSQQLRDAVALIKTLAPRPGSGFSGPPTHYILPDIRVNIIDGELSVTALVTTSVHINPYYLDRLPLVDSLTRSYLRGEIGRGEALIRCIDQRRSTLMMVARAAVDFQREFFLRGAPLATLTMAELASLLGVHESTISRAVGGKHLRYSGGTIPLGKLFCTGLVGGGSTENAKHRIAKLIEGESAAAPLSDDKLTALLAGEGITLSRRAVAKYRDELGIASSQTRKQW